jgi:hypothetical protein
MLICVDCEKINAPWAKQCGACGASLHVAAPNTLISVPAQLSGARADIKPWAPDNEWHSLDEIDGERILDLNTVEPITVIEPSRTADIDWGNTTDGSEKYASAPIQTDSKNRFDEYGYDFEKANNSAWKTTTVLLAGIAVIAVLGGFAIGYLHSTTPNAYPSVEAPAFNKTVKDTTQATSKPIAALPPGPATKGNAAAKTEMIEEIISVSKPNNKVPVIETQATPGSTVQSKIQTKETPPVFVMSASEPILAKPKDGKVVASPKKPDVAVATVIKRKPEVKVLPNQTTESADLGRLEPPTVAAVAPSTTTAPTTPVQATQIRLKDKQSSECANSAFLGRVVCQERSRVDFCRNRWNEHPDCQLNNSRLEP